jgi:hypothetical protein
MKHKLALIGAVALAAVVGGCATSPVQRTEALLSQNGFKPVAASTAAQQQRMQSLPPDQISAVKRHGQTYYVYPDPARNLLYVGNKAQYQAYQTALQDQRLAQDAKLARAVQDAPVLNQDALEMSGAGPSWDEIWRGWPE